MKKRNIEHFTNDDDDDDVVDDDDDRNSTRTHRRVLHKSHAHEDDVEEDMDFSRKRSCSLERDGDTSSGLSVPLRDSRSDYREDESIRQIS